MEEEQRLRQTPLVLKGKSWSNYCCHHLCELQRNFQKSLSCPFNRVKAPLLLNAKVKSSCVYKQWQFPSEECELRMAFIYSLPITKTVTDPASLLQWSEWWLACPHSPKQGFPTVSRPQSLKPWLREQVSKLWWRRGQWEAGLTLGALSTLVWKQ